MEIYVIKNIIFCFFLIGFISVKTISSAEQLSFKPGDSATFKVSEKIVQTTSEPQSHENTIIFDLTILSVNPETLSYPFEVEVVLKAIKVNYKDSEENIIYDSDQIASSNEGDYIDYLDSIQQLLNVPLRFRVNGAFDVKEVTGVLEKAGKSNDYFLDDHGILGTTPWSYRFLLTQLFHLSGENLKEKMSYHASCYRLLDWEDAPLDAEKINLIEESNYEIKNIGPEEIEAYWKGEAAVTGDAITESIVKVDSDVQWNCENPLIQKRHLRASIDVTYLLFGFLSIHPIVNVEQTWETLPKK